MRYAGMVSKRMVTMRAKRHLRFSTLRPFAPFSERRPDMVHGAHAKRAQSVRSAGMVSKRMVTMRAKRHLRFSTLRPFALFFGAPFRHGARCAREACAERAFRGNGFEAHG